MLDWYQDINELNKYVQFNTITFENHEEVFNKIINEQFNNFKNKHK